MSVIMKREDMTPELENKNSAPQGKILRLNSKTENIDFSSSLNRFFQFINIADIIAKVQKGAEYIVQIPTEFQQGFDAGEYYMMEGKTTGKMWPTLMKIADSGKPEIVTPLPICPGFIFRMPQSLYAKTIAAYSI